MSTLADTVSFVLQWETAALKSLDSADFAPFGSFVSLSENRPFGSSSVPIEMQMNSAAKLTFSATPLRADVQGCAAQRAEGCRSG